MFIFPAALIGYLLFYFSYFNLYDSPQYYMEKNMNDLAMKALRLSYKESGIESGMRRLKSDSENATSGEKKVNVLNIFCDKKFSKMIRIGFIRVFFFQFSGIFTLLFYSTSVFSKIGSEIMVSRGLTVIVGFILLVANLLFIHVAKCFSRKTIFVAGDVLLALMMAGSGILTQETDTIVGPAILLLAFVLIFGSTVGSVT